MEEGSELRLLLVCFGNICRSPMAQGVLQRRLEQASLIDWVYVESAGTSDFQSGQSPDPRAIRAASRRGYDLSPIRARQAEPADFSVFDLILAADRQNYHDLLALAWPSERSQVELLLSYGHSGLTGLPDPYLDTGEQFDYVLDLIEDAVDGLIEAIRTGRL